MKPTMAVPGVETQTPPSKETQALWQQMKMVALD